MIIESVFLFTLADLLVNDIQCQSYFALEQVPTGFRFLVG